MNTRPSKDAIQRAGQVLATARRRSEQMDPRTLAEQAWHVGCRYSVDELEDRIRRRRGLPALDRDKAAS